ncbi:MAG: hypothetical protein LJE90_16620 [Betaproteobacteria bacterium]|nr:hypothetical protein [Betaproteobacteria bacterium]
MDKSAYGDLMRETASTAPTRVVVIDLLSLILLAVAAGLAFGIALGGMTLLFASQNARAEPPAVAPGGSVIERPVEQPTGNPLRPEFPPQPGSQPARTMV